MTVHELHMHYSYMSRAATKTCSYNLSALQLFRTVYRSSTSNLILSRTLHLRHSGLNFHNSFKRGPTFFLEPISPSTISLVLRRNRSKQPTISLAQQTRGRPMAGCGQDVGPGQQLQQQFLSLILGQTFALES